MPATFKIELKAEARKDGTRAVRIRITKARKHAYYNLGKYVLASQWNKAGSRKLANWIVKHDEAGQYNNVIKNTLAGLEQVSDALPAATAAGIKEAYENAINPQPKASEKKHLPFFEFADEYIARLKDRNFHTGKSCEYEINEFRRMFGERTPIESLFTARNLHKYIKHLKDKKNSPRTIERKIIILQRVYKAGVKEKQLPDIGNPFEDVKITVPKKKLVRPTSEQIRQFIAYEPNNELQTMAKDVAMLQYLLQGARIGEAITLEWSGVHESYVEYLPQKGASKPKFIPRSRMLNILLDKFSEKKGRYVLPYLGEDFHDLSEKKKFYRKNRIGNQVNKGLKEISGELGMNIDLTSHMFRHAFADAVIATGSSIHVAAALLGHSNARTTENYIRDLKLDDVSDVSLSIFDKLEGEQSGKHQENN